MTSGVGNLNDISPSIAAHPRTWSLRVVIPLMLVLPIALVSAALIVISLITSRGISEQLGQQLAASATARVDEDVRSYLRSAVEVSDAYTRRLQRGVLPSSPLAEWEPSMFSDLTAHSNVASICFGNPGGDAIYLERIHDRLEYGLADGSRDCQAIELVMSPTGVIDRDHPIRTYRYDARARPWYLAALGRVDPIWTDVYFWFGKNGQAGETGAGYTRGVRNSGGALSGVLVIDVTLGALSEHLQRQPFASQGSIFIIDSQDLLVAASAGDVTSADGRRLSLAESDSDVARGVAGSIRQASATVLLQTVGKARLNVSSFHPYPGIDWRIATVLPESAFLQQVNMTRDRSVLMASIALAGALIIGLLLSRRIIRPLLQLSEHVARIGAGQFDSRLTLSGTTELNNLAEQTNQMAAGLRGRLELEKSLELASHVQRSLLPSKPPRIAGLDIAARSRYCDSTGGDYYDFIDVVSASGGQVLVVVGDVVGHGIGSALLMATARAALRTAAASGEVSLGQLLSRVNDIIAADSHGQFMTMALLRIDPQARKAEWASAGHDPSIVFEPAADALYELEGGDIPLGIVFGTQYQDFARDGIAPGGVVVIGTDGVWEARNPTGEMFGKDRFQQAIRTAGSSNAAEVADRIEGTLKAFTAGESFKDDVTFVVMKLAT